MLVSVLDLFFLFSCLLIYPIIAHYCRVSNCSRSRTIYLMSYQMTIACCQSPYFGLLFSLIVTISGLIAFIINLLVTNQQGATTSLAIIIISRLVQGLGSYSRIDSLLFVSQHYVRHSYIYNGSGVESTRLPALQPTNQNAVSNAVARRKLVIRFGCTYNDTRLWWGPLLGTL